MGRYFYLQLKRLARYIPLSVLVVAILFGSLGVVYTQAVKLLDDSQQEVRLKVAMVGSLDDSYLQLGLAALQTFDSSRMALEIVEMDENDARRAMEQGDIAAMVIVPEGFLEAAMRGDIMPLKYVTTSGAMGLVSILKEEITQVINQILVHAQKGIYGAGNAASDAGASAGQVINGISIQYVEFIFDRSQVYSVKELGVGDDLGLEGHMLCGLSVLFLLLACLPFAPLRIRRDLALGRMLASRRKCVTGQVAWDFGAYSIAVFVILGVLVALLRFSGAVRADRWEVYELLHLLPVAVMVAALSFLLYELTGDLISGVLIQFFAILVMSFISGCLYPIYFFPETVQKMARYLPTAIAREQLSGLVTGRFSSRADWALLGFGAVFFLCALAVRKYRTAVVRG